MAELIVYRGLPGCGKTTDASAELTRRPRGSAVVLSRDVFRRHIFRTHFQPDDPDFEGLVTALQHGAIAIALRKGLTVFCDDTNLYADHVAALLRLAVLCDVKYWIRDFTYIPLWRCIEQDARRRPGLRVGEDVIQAMFDKHSPDGWAPMPMPLPDPI